MAYGKVTSCQVIHLSEGLIVSDHGFFCFFRTYPALETLTEPHRLIACLHCVVAVARQMISSHKWYPEGRSHVIPLLNLSLPGIDPNDIKKSLVTFQLISTLVSLVPLRDCSEAPFVRTDLTEVTIHSALFTPVLLFLVNHTHTN